MVSDPAVWNQKKFEKMLGHIVSRICYSYNIPMDVKIPGFRLHWLCYLCDFGYFEKTGHSISGSPYVHGNSGPVPIYFDKTVKELITDDIIELDSKKNISIGSDCRYIPKANDVCEMPVSNGKNGLSPDEMIVIDEIVAKYMDVSDEELKSMVMDDTPFIAAGDCQALNYGLAYYRTEEMSEGGGEDD